MQSPEALLTIAQIAAAFAGFASIVIAITGRDGTIRSPADMLRFRIMLYSSLSAIGFSLLPFAFLYMGVLEPQVWLVCISIVALYLSVNLFLRGRMAFRLVRKREFNPAVVYPFMAVSGGVTFLQLAVLADLVSPSIGPYFLALCYMLMQSAVSFAGLVWGSIKGDPDTNS
jgi:hypothetical protein